MWIRIATDFSRHHFQMIISQKNKNLSKKRFTIDIIHLTLIEIFWNFFNLKLTRNDFVRNMFDSLLISIIIFVCLCVENAIKEYLIEILTQIKFEIEFMHNMIDVEMKCVLRSRWIQRSWYDIKEHEIVRSR
jgi:hypothetical protein